MISPSSNRSTAAKLGIFRACFSGLMDFYGTYDPGTGAAHQVKKAVTDRVFLRHLKGVQPYGVYLLMNDRTRAVVVDFDRPDANAPVEFVRQARYYNIRAYVERSKSKGWHAWIFTELPGVSAAKARLVAKAILADIEQPAVEVFPRQDRLDDGCQYGNFINAPLFGGLVPQGRTIFVDPDHGLKPWPDQWHVLKHVERVGEGWLDELIELNGLGKTRPVGHPSAAPSNDSRGHGGFPLPHCARRMLADGVSDYQRVACFRLAVHLRKLGLPQDITVAALQAWSAKNRPQARKRIITCIEIKDQIASAYAKEYRGCGCEDPAIQPFCDARCPIRICQAEQQERAGRHHPGDGDST